MVGLSDLEENNRRMWTSSVTVDNKITCFIVCNNFLKIHNRTNNRYPTRWRDQAHSWKSITYRHHFLLLGQPSILFPVRNQNKEAAKECNVRNVWYQKEKQTLVMHWIFLELLFKLTLPDDYFKCCAAPLVCQIKQTVNKALNVQRSSFCSPPSLMYGR